MARPDGDGMPRALVKQAARPVSTLVVAKLRGSYPVPAPEWPGLYSRRSSCQDEKKAISISSFRTGTGGGILPRPAHRLQGSCARGGEICLKGRSASNIFVWLEDVSASSRRREPAVLPKAV